jgi:ribonuclease R
MLPEKLSNGLCSLNPDVDRLAVVCEMSITRYGRIEDYRFTRAVIRSQARLTYTRVARSLYGLAGNAEPIPERLLPHLHALDSVYKALARQRAARGAIDFSSQETEFEFDVSGRISAIRIAARNEAYRLIEECMLAANVCAAEFMIERGQPTLFRNHAGPTEEKLEALRTFLKPLGLQLGGAKLPQAKDYSRLIASVQGRPDAQLLEMVLLRSMQQARYAPENLGHFGLGYPAYAHFTSPIRRYPDLLVHRGIKAGLEEKTYRPEAVDEQQTWKSLGEHCSLTERRADEASRDVTQWLKCFYMRDRVGQTFSGIISAVTSFGIFVTLDELFVDGLVHISELGNDYFDFDPVRYELRGARSGEVFRLAQRVAVQIARVDLELARIDLTLDR